MTFISTRRVSGLMAAFFSIALLLVSQDANAFQMRLESSGGTVVTVGDNAAGDIEPTVGAITFSGAIDDFTVVVNTGLSKPVLGDPTQARLDLTGVSSTGASGGTLTVTLTDGNFLSGAGDTTLSSVVSGTTNGMTSFESFIDPGNTEFETNVPPACSSGLQGPFGPGAFSDSVSAICSVTGDFAVTVVAVATLAADSVQSFGTTTRADIPEELLACRFTGGGVDTDMNWDHTLEDGDMIRNGAGNLPAGIDRYQFGGQAGANTGSQPQPKGEWQHHQQKGPSGAFSFHVGTASAAAGTEIVEIRCSDEGYCSQARPAPNKQLDFDGIGTFSNLGKGKNAAVFTDATPTVIAEPNGNKADAVLSFHWVEVNIDDLGEPGSDNTGKSDPTICPARGFGEKSAGPHTDPTTGDMSVLPQADLGECDCPDFYRIAIYRGVLSNTANLFLPDGNIDQSLMNKSDVIYEAYGYIDGGNLQLHPPTGFDTN